MSIMNNITGSEVDGPVSMEGIEAMINKIPDDEEVKRSLRKSMQSV